MRTLIALALVSLALAGCARSQPPLPACSIAGAGIGDCAIAGQQETQQW